MDFFLPGRQSIVRKYRRDVTRSRLLGSRCFPGDGRQWPWGRAFFKGAVLATRGHPRANQIGLASDFKQELPDRRATGQPPSTPLVNAQGAASAAGTIPNLLCLAAEETLMSWRLLQDEGLTRDALACRSLRPRCWGVSDLLLSLSPSEPSQSHREPGPSPFYQTTVS